MVQDDLDFFPPEHDGGLKKDLPRLLSRRRVIGTLAVTGLGATALIYGFGGAPGQAEANQTGTAADGSVCLKHPAETNGPFPADGTNAKDGQTVNALTESGVVRPDIRASFGDRTRAAEGVQLDLVLTLVDVGAGCAPLAGHAIYIWHADQNGHYSLYDLPDANYLRGVGVADAKGQVRFTTILPGCYDGRWPHIHFEVFESLDKAVSGDASLLISQFAIAADTASAAYTADPRYPQSLANLGQVTIGSDNVFGDNTVEQIAAQTLTLSGDPLAGMVGSAVVGIVKA